MVLLVWARRQPDRSVPFLEGLGGPPITPADLLTEPPPFGSQLPLDRRRTDLSYRASQVQAWPRVLNLIAAGAERGDDYVERVLRQMLAQSDASGEMGAPG
jgi:hypothetical protein